MANDAFGAALSWAARGFKVFPTHHKHPLTATDWRTAASSDPIALAVLNWSEADGYGVALDRHAVVDLDPPVEDAQAAYRKLAPGAPPTLTVKTPRGGFHMYYHAPPTDAPLVQRKLAGNIDVRLPGKGYVCGPGAAGYELIEDRELAAFPAPLVPRLIDHGPGKSEDQTPACELDTPASIASVKALLRTSLHNEPSGEDDHRYILACRVRERGLSEELAQVAMLEWNAACDHPRPDHEIEKAVRNAYRHAQNQPGARVAPLLDLIDHDAEPVEEPDPEPPFTIPDAAAVTLTGGRSLPPRPWVYGRALMRGTVTLTAAPGGLGKTSLSVVDALALASGKTLLHDKPMRGPQRVLLFNREEPRVELLRRIEAAAQVHGVTQDDIGDRLMVLGCGEGGRFLLANAEGEVDNDAALALTQELQRRRVDVAILDPFIAFHRAEENSNGAMDAVMKTLASIAQTVGCAIMVYHHSAKGSTLQQDKTAAARGAGALVDGARIMRALSRMTQDEARALGVDPERRSRYIRTDNAKANMAPLDAATWVEIVSAPLDNAADGYPADDVGVVRAWTPPDVAELDPEVERDILSRLAERLDEDPLGSARRDPKSDGWIGHTIASPEFYDLGETQGPPGDADATAVRKRARKKLDAWIDAGILGMYSVPDEHRKHRVCHCFTKAIPRPGDTKSLDTASGEAHKLDILATPRKP